MKKYTARQKAAEARREVTMREQVYGQRAMTNARLRQLAIMREIAEDYEELARAEAPPDLFEAPQ